MSRVVANVGLTSLEAAARLAEFGPNEPTPSKKRHPFSPLVELVSNPLVLILIGAAAISFALGDRTNGGIIVIIVLLSFLLQHIQTVRSTEAVKRLQQEIAPTAVVLRDGNWATIPRSEVVPDDIARLIAGSLVPADGRLLEERDLHVQEAALTGESMPVEKEVGASEAEERVFLGTAVVSGTGTMRVEQTGPRTQFGEIAVRLSERAPETEFERGLRQFGGLIMKSVVVLVGFALAAMLALHRDPFQSFLFAVALAVGLTPEFLPMIVTLTLSKGAVRMAKQKVIVKNLASIQNFGSMDVLCSDKTGTLTSGEMTLDQSLDAGGFPSSEPEKWARINARFQDGVESPLDAAILEKGQPEAGWQKIDEIPFDFERRRLSVVTEKEGRRVLITKGAIENVLGVCGPGTDSAGIQRIGDEMGREGFRVIAVAIKDVSAQLRYGIEDEADLVMVGLLAFIDPPLPEALQMIHRLQGAGIELKVITGDGAAVTRHICEQIGLDPGNIVLGSEIESMTDPALQAMAEKSLVFARVSPAQKNRIILALKARGHVVGYMGDGINDAPSLHTADVGISFATGTEVAKDAAQIVLVERNLGLLHKGVLEGRMAFGNVMKYLLMGTSSNFGNMFSMAGAAAFLPFLPMLPAQILLNNLMYDAAQVTIPTDRVDPTYIRKPRRWDNRLIRDFMIFVGPISSIFDFLTFWVLLSVFHAKEAEFHTGWFVESLATQTLVIFVIRTRFAPWRSRPSRPLFWTTVGIVAAGALLPYSPLAGPLGFTPLPPLFFAFLVAATIAYLAMVEGVKRLIFARYAPA